MKPICRIVQQRFPHDHPMMEGGVVVTVERWWNGSADDGRALANIDLPPKLPFAPAQLRLLAEHLVGVAAWMDGGCQ